MSLTPSQQRTLKAREALKTKLGTPEQRSEHFRHLAERSASRRRGGVVLSKDEADALGAAYALLRSVAHRVTVEPADPAGDIAA